MLADEIIQLRLQEMAQQDDPSNSLWPENCEGSRRALVIFVGPSPGGKKEKVRRDINRIKIKPLWNKSYLEPMKWSTGFRISYRPLVEKIIGVPFEETSKLIARFNMDWMGNPESRDVSYRYMWEGCKYILPILAVCDPELVIPMDGKTFGVLQIALYDQGYEIFPVKIGSIKVRISNKDRKVRNHTTMMAFRARKNEQSFGVIKSFQHPARIYEPEYAERIGKAIRIAANQISSDVPVSLNI